MQTDKKKVINSIEKSILLLVISYMNNKIFEITLSVILYVVFLYFGSELQNWQTNGQRTGTLILHCNKDFLPVQHKGYDEPERGAPERLRQLGGVRPHPARHEVEGEEVISHTVAAVQKDRVHARVEEGLALPVVLQVDGAVEQGEKEEGETGGDQDEGERPQVLGNDAVTLHIIAAFFYIQPCLVPDVWPPMLE